MPHDNKIAIQETTFDMIDSFLTVVYSSIFAYSTVL